MLLKDVPSACSLNPVTFWDDWLLTGNIAQCLNAGSTVLQ